MARPYIYRSSDTGAPTLDGSKGSLIDVLKACLTNTYYTPVTIISLTRSGSTATAVTASPHGLVTPSIIGIAGVDQTEYNGQFLIAVTDSTTFTYTISGTPVTPATTGTSITVALPDAGWTVAIEDAPNDKIIFRNDSVTGSGRYFRIQDNGRVASGTTTYHTTDRMAQAALVGMRGCSDRNTPLFPFPRVISGGDLVDNYAYGVTIRKTGGTANPTYKRPWMVIADNRTCYIVTNPTSTVDSTAMPTDADTPYIEKERGLYGFGDIKSLNPSNTLIPEAFVFGGTLGAVDVITGGTYEGTASYGSVTPLANTTTVYVDASMENSSVTAKAFVSTEWTGKILTTFGGNCRSTAAVGEYERYPSPTGMGFTFEPLWFMEDLSDPIRTFQYSQNHTRFVYGRTPGLGASPHTTESGTGYAIGDSLTQYDDLIASKSYLLCSLMYYQQARLLASDTIKSNLYVFELEDWWA